MDFYVKRQNALWLLFSFAGRASRTQFWVGHLFYLIMAALTAGALFGFSDLLNHYLGRSESEFPLYLVITFWVVLLYVMVLAVWIKRLHDLGAPGGVIVPIYLVPKALDVASENWFVGTSFELPLAFASLLLFVAILGFVGFRSGEPEPNEYGSSAGPEYAISDLK
jgi:uncharacterized membrane protein YhaH (DUF805 family)